MEWMIPTMAEIKMDAEIGSYQEDRDLERVPMTDHGPPSVGEDPGSHMMAQQRCFAWLGGPR